MANAPIPTNLRAINGNPGKRRLESQGEPDPAYLDDLSPPPFLTGEKARQVWEYIAPKLREDRLLCAIDVFALVRLCEDMAEAWMTQQSVTALLERGELPVYTGAKGGTNYDPAYVVRNRAAERLDKGFAHFGMSPMARTRIRSNPQTDLFEGGGYEELLRQVRTAA